MIICSSWGARSAAASIAVFCGLAVSTCLFPEKRTTQYETLQVAQEDGLFIRGWLPPVLPDDAGPIVELHDIDTNARCSTSGFPEQKVSGVETALIEEGFEVFSGRLPPLPFRDCPFEAGDVSPSDTLFLRTTAFGGELAVVSSQGRLLFWSH